METYISCTNPETYSFWNLKIENCWSETTDTVSGNEHKSS